MVISKIKLIGIADILTMSNAACGLFAIVAFIWFYPNITYGTGLIFLGLVFDGMDGAAARKFGTKHDFGRHLDSIADACTFVLAPSVLVFVVFSVDVFGGSTRHFHPRKIASFHLAIKFSTEPFEVLQNLLFLLLS